jgi:hypothetical protein
MRDTNREYVGVIIKMQQCQIKVCFVNIWLFGGYKNIHIKKNIHKLQKYTSTYFISNMY